MAVARCSFVATPRNDKRGACADAGAEKPGRPPSNAEPKAEAPRNLAHVDA